ncbi:hypothetical protein [Pelomicrobium methylotrophicum]|uniref:Uncharacterized protein n=1 Tax=Pelomicrobium methylotrophicum TaxID=2602750 RepID=A0A5C7EPL5_9PROT|nr:hypothetical protein [Pelomicrobium methylotrophicum]TXF09891.1 hypothetical protein FR698_16445 [Pelomicrobium methylotrophicum]
MKDDKTVDELLDLLQAIARWFFWPYACGELTAADDQLDALLGRILHSDQTKDLVQDFRARLGERRRAGFEAPQHQRAVLERNLKDGRYPFTLEEYVQHQRGVLEIYAIGQAARAVDFHVARQGNRTARRAAETRDLGQRRSHAPSRVPERAGSELEKYEPQQYLQRGLVALALAGIEDPQHPCLVLIGRSIRLIGMHREEIFEEAASLVGEPAASLFREYASRAPRETKGLLRKLGWREEWVDQSFRYRYAIEKTGWF